MGEKGGCFWGELPLRGLLDWGREDAACVWGSSRCAELLGWGREEAAFGGGGGGAPAARGCSIERERRLLWGELPLRGAARLRV